MQTNRLRARELKLEAKKQYVFGKKNKKIKKSWINEQIKYEDENGYVHGLYVFRF